MERARVAAGAVLCGIAVAVLLLTRPAHRYFRALQPVWAVVPQ
jgi:hypothetical protein